MDLQKYQKLKERVETLKRESDKEVGALEQMKKRLKKDFNCDSTKQAEKLLLELEDEVETTNKKYEEAIKKLEDDFGELLDGDNN